MKITVVGLGLIGGSMALSLRAKGFATQIIGVDANEVHRKKALDLNLVDSVSGLENALSETDLVILSVPVNTICKIIPAVMDSIAKEVTVTDVGSTKELIAKTAGEHANHRQFIPAHPMAGTENSGPGSAFEGLFCGKTAVLCDTPQKDAFHVERVRKMYETLEMRTIYMDSKSHDRHAAYVSHLSHISSFVLANTVLDIEKDTATIFDLAGGGFESTVRLAKSSPEMWLPIFEQNRGPITEALGAYINQLEIFYKNMLGGKWSETAHTLHRANEIRRVLESLNSKGNTK